MWWEEWFTQICTLEKFLVYKKISAYAWYATYTICQTLVGIVFQIQFQYKKFQGNSKMNISLNWFLFFCCIPSFILHVELPSSFVCLNKVEYIDVWNILYNVIISRIQTLSSSCIHLSYLNALFLYSNFEITFQNGHTESNADPRRWKMASLFVAVI